jgi:c-di-GMP-binding flagellar brake protein YcgR
MTRSFCIDLARQASLFREAVVRKVPILLDWKHNDGYHSLKARMIHADDETELLLECPVRVRDELPGGQTVNVSFRRGHKKCAFETFVLGFDSTTETQRNGRCVLRLAWPEDVVELQRRLYHRAAVPQGVTVPVDLWQGELDAPSRLREPHCEATMMDISAGGMSVALQEPRVPELREDDAISCSFLLEPMEPPVRVSGRVRHRDALPDGRVCLGVQFMGIDAAADQRDTLSRITQLTSRLQRL